LRVNAGCFSGTIDEFRAAVNGTHANNPEQRAQYLAFADLFELHFKLADQMDARGA